MRTPSVAHRKPGPPRGGQCYAVRYVDTGGQGTTIYTRTHAGALRAAQRIRDRGGEPVIYVAPIDGWTELDEVASP